MTSRAAPSPAQPPRAGLLARLGRGLGWLRARLLGAPPSETATPAADAPGPVETAPTRLADALARTTMPSPAPAAPRKAPATRPAQPPRRAAQPRAKPTRGAGLVSIEALVEDTRIHAVERPGRSRERAIVMIHGAGLDHRDWTFRFLDRIETDIRLIAVDRPGFGRSGRPRGAAAALPATQARLLRRALASLGVERAILVGHSWGGAVAMAWAIDAPESVEGVLSLAGAVAPWSLATSIKNGRRIQAAAMTAFGAGGMRAAAIEALTESFAPDPVPEGYLEHVRSDLTPLSSATTATMADVSTINGALALMTPRYGSLARPVELVYGDADVILSPAEQGEAAAALLPRARLTVLPGVGHMVHHADPGACLAALARLIGAAGRA